MKPSIRWTFLFAVLLQGCPIAPDFESEDAGVVDSGTVVDAGTTDGGVGGTILVQLTTSTGSTAGLAWNGADVAQTSIDAEGSSGPSQVTLVGNDSTAGSLKLTLSGLVPGSTSGQVVSLTYQPASGPDIWSCSVGTATGCSVQVTLSDYDGSVIVGTFSASFAADANETTAVLSSGSFDITLP